MNVPIPRGLSFRSMARNEANFKADGRVLRLGSTVTAVAPRIEFAEYPGIRNFDLFFC